MIKAIEEVAELTKALTKQLNSGKEQELLDAINEECADVEIMLNQLQVIFGDCSEWEYFKLERLKDMVYGITKM